MSMCPVQIEDKAKHGGSLLSPREIRKSDQVVPDGIGQYHCEHLERNHFCNHTHVKRNGYIWICYIVYIGL